MTSDLSAHGNLMGGVRKATRPQKLSISKKTQTRIDNAVKKTFGPKDEKKDNASSNKVAEQGQLAAPVSSKDSGKEGPINVSSTRVMPNPPNAIGGPSSFVPTTGPAQITPPGPSAKESAKAKSEKAKKGTKNTSTIKVAEPSVNLEEGPSFGKPVYSITDVPRQWNKNG